MICCLRIMKTEWDFMKKYRVCRKCGKKKLVGEIVWYRKNESSQKQL